MSASLPGWELQYLNYVFFVSAFKSHTGELLVNTDMEPQREENLESLGSNVTHQQGIKFQNFSMNISLIVYSTNTSQKKIQKASRKNDNLCNSILFDILSSVQSLSRVQLFETPWTATR